MSILEENEKRLGAAGKSPVPALRFIQLIREVARKYATQAVILIDEKEIYQIVRNIPPKD